MPRVTVRWPDADQLVAAVAAAGGPHRYAKSVGRAPSTLYGHMRREGLEERVRHACEDTTSLPNAVRAAARAGQRALTGEQKPTTEVKGNTATLISDPAPDLGDIDELLRERGLDPADWEVDRAKLNEWDAMTSDKATGDNRVIKMRQLTVHLKRRVPITFVFPAVDVRERVYCGITAVGTASFVSVCLPDQHAPYHDEEANERLLDLLVEIEPDRLVNLGDLGDYASISRHRDNPAWAAGPQESVQASYGILATQRDALPNAEIVLLKGNHDWRLETELLARAERMYGIAPADVPGQEQVPAYSLRHLLHLDDLHVQLVEPDLAGDNYEHAEFWLSDDLVCMHGAKTKPGAALATAVDVGASVIMGHTHRQSLSTKTVWTGSDFKTLTGAEAGTLRSITKSVGYTSRPNWQHGAVVATVHADGSHDLELLRWDGARWTWRGQQY